MGEGRSIARSPRWRERRNKIYPRFLTAVYSRTQDTTTNIPRALTPETRRGHLRAIADRKLLALSREEDPKPGEEIKEGIRRGLLIRRLYARYDATEAKAIKNAGAGMEQEGAATKDAPAPATPKASDRTWPGNLRRLMRKTAKTRRDCRTLPRPQGCEKARHPRPR